MLDSLSRSYSTRLAEVVLQGSAIDLPNSMLKVYKIDSKKLSMDIISLYKNEGKRLRLLYNTRQRYPEVYKQVRVSGNVYWNGLKVEKEKENIFEEE